MAMKVSELQQLLTTLPPHAVVMVSVNATEPRYAQDVCAGEHWNSVLEELTTDLIVSVYTPDYEPSPEPRGWHRIEPS